MTFQRLRRSIGAAVLAATTLFPAYLFAAGADPGVTAPDGRRTDTWQERKAAMMRFGLYVTPKNDIPLREFRGGEDAVSRAIGRGKALLVRHQLRHVAGAAVYDHLTADHRVDAGRPWDELRALFEKETGRDLGWFFAQWIERKGLPELGADNAQVRRNGARFEVSFNLLQKGVPYVLEVPLRVTFMSGSIRAETIRTDSERMAVTLSFDEEPADVTLDPEYDVPRVLTADEVPPMIAALLAEEKILLVPPVSDRDRYQGALTFWRRQHGVTEKDADQVREADIRSSSLLLLGTDNPLISRLFGRAGRATSDLSLTARKNPWNTGKVVVMVGLRSAALASESAWAMTPAGECTTFAIDAQGRLTQTTDEAEQGIIMQLRLPAVAVDVSALRSQDEVIRKAAEKTIVYIGEYHDRHAHHLVQLDVIKAMHRKDPNISIGMEMFQKPSQKALDDYISGAINEREFLRRSEYFSRWSYDYNLYKPILDFARAERVRVVALNVRKEVVEKVSQGGFDALTPDERRELPAEMDFTDDDYRDHLVQVFGQHRSPSERSFDAFYQAQVLWDEAMAQSIHEHLMQNPGKRMAVVAGLGHIAYGSGIPKRTFRRNGLDYVTVLNDVDPERAIADYILYPQPLDGLSAPKLMVVLKQANGSVTITDLPEGSVSRKAGIKPGDVVLAVDDERISSIDDLKIALFFKKRDDTVRVTVQRKRFLLGATERVFELKVQ